MTRTDGHEVFVAIAGNDRRVAAAARHLHRSLQSIGWSLAVLECDVGPAILLVEQNVRAVRKISGYAYLLEMGTIAAEGSVDLTHDFRIPDVEFSIYILLYSSSFPRSYRPSIGVRCATRCSAI
jgi:hypothetical protein